MDIGKGSQKSMHRTLKRTIIIAIGLWTAVCAGSLAYHVHDSQRHVVNIANETARESIQKDMLYRYWAAGHGGVYVPVTKETPPNPYLVSVKERDITTPSGRRLTLMNPAYMTRQIHELGAQFTDVQGHITSLKPIRPENAPDVWEAKALRAIEAGEREFGETVDFKGAPHYRLMLPLYTERPCLKCHMAQGRQLGSLSGGLSAAIPMAIFTNVSRDHLRSEAMHFGAIWVLGLAGAGVVVPFVRRRIREQETAEDALRRNWEFTQSIIENEPECVKILGRGGEVAFMNRAGLAMIDAASLGAVLGQQVQQLVVPEHREAFVRLNERVFAGESGSLEFEIVGLKGSRRWLETHAVPLRDAAGKVESLLGITRDVTERKRAEESIRERDFWFRESQRVARLGSYVLDIPSGTWTSSEILDDIFGIDETYTRSVQGWAGLIHPDDRERMTQHFAGVIAEKKRFMADYRIIRKGDQAVRWVSGLGELAIDGNGTPVKMLGTIQDITESKQAEDALRKSEERLREAQHIGKIGSWELDIATKVLWWSDEVYAIFGRDPAKAVTFGAFLERIHPDDRDRVQGSIEEAVRRALDTWQVEYRIVLENGELRYLYENAAAAKNGAGDVVQRRGIVQDITARKLAEQQNKHLEQQLLQAQKIESVGRLAGGIAHDINNMLMPILGYAEMLTYKIPDGDERREDLAEITGAATRVKDMTQQLLAFARKQTLDVRPLDVNVVISRFGKMLRRTLRENILIKLDLALSIGTVPADERQLEQVILNLAVNAQDAMPGGGVVMISTKDAVLDESFARTRPGLSPGRYVVIKVSDTGMGMDGETQTRLFEPFFTTKEPGRGTGLGLATVYGIIKQHKGYVDVQSELRQGATFSLYLPVTDESVGSEATGEQKVLQRGSESILVVEDQDQVLRLVSLMLGESGYRVLTALSGREALEKAASFAGDIHLVISDVIMPDMNGKELLEKLRKVRQNVKVLYMSGYAAEVISSQGVLDSGVNFIRKPFSVHELTAKVRQVLDGNGGGRG